MRLVSTGLFDGSEEQVVATSSGQEQVVPWNDSFGLAPASICLLTTNMQCARQTSETAPCEVALLEMIFPLRYS